VNTSQRSRGRQLRLFPSKLGGLRIWHHPLPDREYTIGVDVAEGKVRDGTLAKMRTIEDLRSARDYSAAMVIDDTTGALHASYHANIFPNEVATAVYALALYYNDAHLAIEVSGPGRGVQDLVTNEWGYRNCMIPRHREYVAPDFSATPEYGFKTSSVTRPMLITLAHEYLADPSCYIPDMALVDEYSKVEYDDTGKARGRGKNKDDRVFAHMIALFARREKLIQGNPFEDTSQSRLPMQDQFTWEAVNRRVSQHERERRNWCDDF
jgi:hypothetical protein